MRIGDKGVADKEKKMTKTTKIEWGKKVGERRTSTCGRFAALRNTCKGQLVWSVFRTDRKDRDGYSLLLCDAAHNLRSAACHAMQSIRSHGE